MTQTQTIGILWFPADVGLSEAKTPLGKMFQMVYYTERKNSILHFLVMFPLEMMVGKCFYRELYLPFPFCCDSNFI